MFPVGDHPAFLNQPGEVLFFFSPQDAPATADKSFHRNPRTWLLITEVAVTPCADDRGVSIGGGRGEKDPPQHQQ